MTRTATAVVPTDHRLVAAASETRTAHSLARKFGRFAVGGVIAAIMFVFVEPLTLPWIVTAYAGAATILGTTILANR